MSSNGINENLDCLSNILKQFISGSSDILDIYESINGAIKNLNDRLIRANDTKCYQKLIENNFDEILVYTTEICRRRGHIKLLYSILTLLVTITHNSMEFTLLVATSNLFTLLIDDTIKFSSMKDNNTKQLFLFTYLSVTFNIIRNYQCRETFLLNSKLDTFKNVLSKSLSLDLPNIKVISMMVLSLLVKDDEESQAVILQHTHVLESIQKIASKALKNKEKTYQGFEIGELLLVLQSLVACEPIKIKLIKFRDFVPSIINVISFSCSSVKHVTTALDILIEVCNDEKIRKKILKRFKIDVIMELLIKSPEESIKKRALCVLQYIRLLSGSPPVTSHEKFEWELSTNDSTLISMISSNKSDHSKDETRLFEFGSIKAHFETFQLESNCEKVNLTSWNQDRVSQWLTDNKLTNIHNKFNGLDGDMLSSLRKMKINCPQIYYKELESSLQLSFLEILRFDGALDKIID